MRRARLAAEFADRAVDPADPLRAGSSLALALSLYREASYWALLAHDENAKANSTREAFEASKSTLTKTGLTNEELATVRTALVDKTFIETANDRAEVLSAETNLCQRFVHALLHGGDIDREERITTLLIQRSLRTSFLLIIFAAALFGGTAMLRHALESPDLVLGKPWRTSSRAYECHAENNECGGARTAIFFHTNEEVDPWLEIDLRVPQTIGRIEVENRDDCCAERAVPLIAEVSDDQKHWREVARRPDVFRQWVATFKPVKARYLRLRVSRRSVLHLAHVSARAK